MRKSLSADWLIISRVTEQLTTCNLDQCLQANRPNIANSFKNSK